MRLIICVLSAALWLTVSAPSAYAQLIGIGSEKTLVREDFRFPSDGGLKILALRPQVSVGEQSMAGLDQPNADWTESARTNLEAALRSQLNTLDGEIVSLADVSGEEDSSVSEYTDLFRAVVDTVMLHKLGSNSLPTKKGKFDWTLGEGVRKLSSLCACDYALLTYTRDSYGSAGRKALQIVSILLQSPIQSGVHIGYAGLVDLKTGDLVWLNADIAMGGDVRETDGAIKRVSQLLEGLPVRASAAQKALP